MLELVLTLLTNRDSHQVSSLCVLATYSCVMMFKLQVALRVALRVALQVAFITNPMTLIQLVIDVVMYLNGIWYS